MWKTSLALFLLIAISSCKQIPDGKDDNGYYKCEFNCLKSHDTIVRYRQRSGKTSRIVKDIVTICDSSECLKIYIKPQDVDPEWLKDNL